MSAKATVGLLASMILLIAALFVITGGTIGRDIKVATTSVWTAFSEDAHSAFAVKKPEPKIVDQERETAAVVPREEVAAVPVATPGAKSEAKPETKIAIKPEAKPKPQPKATKKAAPSNDRRVTYRASGNGWNVVSGLEGGNIFWEKTKTVNGKPKTVRFVYPPSEREKYDKLIASVDLQF